MDPTENEVIWGFFFLSSSSSIFKSPNTAYLATLTFFDICYFDICFTNASKSSTYVVCADLACSSISDDQEQKIRRVLCAVMRYPHTSVLNISLVAFFHCELSGMVGLTFSTTLHK